MGAHMIGLAYTLAVVEAFIYFLLRNGIRVLEALGSHSDAKPGVLRY